MTSIKSQKFYADKDNRVTIVCPSCGHTRKADASKYEGSRKGIKVRCKCKEVFLSIVDHRMYHRKRVDLYGKYLNQRSGNGGTIIIRNVSLTGIGFIVLYPTDFTINDDLDLSFALGDPEQDLVTLKVKVKVIRDKYIGCQILDREKHPLDLWFYLEP